MADNFVANLLAEIEVAANEQSNNDEQLKRLVDFTCKKINSHLPSENKEESLRKICYVIVLNCENRLFKKLQSNMETGNFIRVDDPLPPKVLVEILWTLSLQEFISEVIQYSPPYIVLPLLPELKKKVDSLDDIYLTLQYVKEFSLSMYIRLMKDAVSCKVSQASEEMFTYFKKYLNYFDGENSVKLKELSAEELYKYSAYVIHSILDLLIKCINSHDFKDENLESFYSGSCIEDVNSDNTTSNLSVTELHSQIISICKKNLSILTFDIWVIWAEIDCEQQPEKTMQTVIAEHMYVALQCLSNLKDTVDISELLQVLTAMAKKPEDEDDKIRKATLEDIIKCVSNDVQSEDKHKWFAALLNYNSLDDSYLSCLENALSLVELSDVKVIIDKVVCELKGEISDEMSERLKNLAINAVRHLHLFDQFEVLEYYVSAYKDTSLCTSNFRSSLVKVLNKAAELSYIDDQQDMSTFICLSIESPKDVLVQIIEEGVKSIGQAAAMAGILKELRVVAKVHESCVINKFKEILTDTEWDEKNINNFLHLVILLINDSIINSERFMMEVVSLLITAGRDSYYQLLNMCLRILQRYISEKVLRKFDVCLLITVAQILEITQWDITSFSQDVTDAHENSAQVVKGMIDIMMETECTLPDKSLKFLQTFILRLSPMNIQYFSKLLLWMGLDSSNIVNFDTALVHLANCRAKQDACCEKALEIFNTETKERDVIFLLCMILPRLCSSQWMEVKKVVFSLFTNIESRFRIYYKVAVLILNSTHCQNGKNLEFTKYFMNNMAKMLQLCSARLIQSDYSKVKLFSDLVHILSSVPSDVRDNCCVPFITLLTDIIKRSDRECVKDFIILTHMIEAKETCQVLYRQVHSLIEEKNS